jgi:putative transcriptional regulator
MAAKRHLRPVVRATMRYPRAMPTNDMAPGLLLASPRLGDPNFERTVVLLGRHEPGGALGWVINGRIVMSVRELLRSAGLVPEGTALPSAPSFDQPARVGGPVSPASGWIVYRRVGPALAGEIDVGPDLAVTGDVNALAAVIRGEGPQEFRLLVGYAGWGPGQLEAEVGAGAWLPTSVDAPLLLDTTADKLWDAAYHRAIGAAPGAFTARGRGSA